MSYLEQNIENHIFEDVLPILFFQLILWHQNLTGGVFSLLRNIVQTVCFVMSEKCILKHHKTLLEDRMIVLKVLEFIVRQVQDVAKSLCPHVDFHDVIHEYGSIVDD